MKFTGSREVFSAISLLICIIVGFCCSLLEQFRAWISFHMDPLVYKRKNRLQEKVLLYLKWLFRAQLWQRCMSKLWISQVFCFKTYRRLQVCVRYISYQFSRIFAVGYSSNIFAVLDLQMLTEQVFLMSGTKTAEEISESRAITLPCRDRGYCF